MRWARKCGIGIDTTGDCPHFAVVARGLGKITIDEIGIWPPEGELELYAISAVLPYWSPRVQIAVGSGSNEEGAPPQLLSRSRAEAVLVKGPRGDTEWPLPQPSGLDSLRVAYDPCGLSLRHLVATHPAVLRGDPTVVVDWAPTRLLLLGFLHGRLSFCSCRATPRNLGTLARELERWSGGKATILFCGNALKDPARVIDEMGSRQTSAEILDPFALLGDTRQVQEPWRYALAIAMALASAIPRGADLLFSADQRRCHGGRWHGWAIPLLLLLMGGSGFALGEAARLRAHDSVLQRHTLPEGTDQSSATGGLAPVASMPQWPRVLRALARRRPSGCTYVGMELTALPEGLILDLTVRCSAQESSAELLERLTSDGLFHRGTVVEVKARPDRDSGVVEYDCRLRADASM